MSGRCLVLDERDDVATALEDLAAGDAVILEGASTASGVPRTTHPIAFGHKLALHAIAAGAPVRKYGEVIGIASMVIAAGDHVHVHNLESARARGDRA